MASIVYQNGLAKLGNGTDAFLSSTLKWLITATTTPYTPNKDDDVVDAGGANDIVDAELNVTGYTRGWGGAGRKTATSKTITINDTNDRVDYDCADPSWTALGAGETMEALILVKEGASNDTTSYPIVYLDPSNVATNGSDVTGQMPANGFMQIAC